MVLFPDNLLGAAVKRLLGAACAAGLACTLAVGVTGCQSGTDASAGGSQGGQPQQSESAADAESDSASSVAGKAEGEEAVVDVAVFDAKGNPAFAAMLELDGEVLQQEIEAAGYAWSDDGAAWFQPESDVMFFIEGPGGSLGPNDMAALTAGAVNKNASYAFTAYGYESPAEALTGLTAEVPIGRRIDADGASFALVTNSGGQQFLIAVVRDGRGGQIGLTFSDNSVAAGLFERLIGANAGDSVSKAWEYCRSVY